MLGQYFDRRVYTHRQIAEAQSLGRIVRAARLRNVGECR